ncbi:MAG: hypothetical protein QXZ17_02630 [Nitrososphaerota archaeon]
MGGHWVKEPGKPLTAHIDIRIDGKKVGEILVEVHIFLTSFIEIIF